MPGSLFHRIQTDRELATEIWQAADDDSRLWIAQKEGFTFTLEELEAARDELDDATLDAVAGALMSSQCGDNKMTQACMIESGHKA